MNRPTGSVTGEGGIDQLGPRINAARDIGRGRVALRAEKLGDALAASAVVAHDQERLILWQFRQLLRDLSHRNVLCDIDATDLQFKRFTHIDEDGGCRFLIQQGLRFGHGNFKWVVGLVHFGRIDCFANRGVTRRINVSDGGMRAAQRAGLAGSNGESLDMMAQRIVGQQPAPQRLGATGDKFDHFHRLHAANDAAQCADYAGLAATGHAAGGGWLREQTAITRSSMGGIKHADLALKFEYAAMHERPLGEASRVVVQVAHGKIIGPIHNDVVTRKKRDGVLRGDAVGMGDKAHVGVERAKGFNCRPDLVFAHGVRAMKQLALEIVFRHFVHVRYAQGADTRRGQIKGGGTAETAGAHDQYPGGSKFLLTGQANFLQQDLPTVASHTRGLKWGWFIRHEFKRGDSPALANEIAPNQTAHPNGRMRCLGIDYGTRRIGLGYGDEIGVATPLPALVQATPEQRWQALGDVIKQRRITDLVLGYPYNMDDSVGFKAKEVDAFAEALKSSFGLPVHLVDERLTSFEAESSIAKHKRRDMRASGLVDSRAATIILQDFLDQRLPPIVPEEEEEE